MVHGNRETGSTALAAVALVIAVIALILAWVAYDRTGGALDERIQDGVERSVQTVEGAAEGAAEGAQEPVDSETAPRETDSDTQTTQ